MKIETEFTGLPLRKLQSLLNEGWSVNGVHIQRAQEDGTVKHGAVTTGGMVLWWQPEQERVIAPSVREVMQQALEALEEIALAGMSGSGQESEEGMRDWHARQAWKFIGIAARAKDPLREALAAPNSVEFDGIKTVAQQEPVAWLHPVNACCVTTDPTAYARGIPLYTAPQQAPQQAPDALNGAAQHETVAWVWNPASEAWERVHVFGFWQPGAIYAFGPTPPADPQPAEPVNRRAFDAAMRQWEHWKKYAMELQERLVKFEGGAPMHLNSAQQEPDRLHLAAMDLARTQAQRIAELEQQLAARGPLTDDEWFEFWKNCDEIPGDSVYPEFLELARIVEAYYGIPKGST